MTERHVARHRTLALSISLSAVLLRPMLRRSDARSLAVREAGYKASSASSVIEALAGLILEEQLFLLR